jgi:uncharacterized protein YndB with AHSA1/START domain
MLTYDVTAVSTASPAVVWRLLVDARTRPTWSPVDSLVTDRSSGPDPGGEDQVGAVRAFRTGWMVTGERLTGLVENEHLTYEDAFNWAIRNYGRSSTWRPRQMVAPPSTGMVPMTPAGRWVGS